MRALLHAMLALGLLHTACSLRGPRTSSDGETVVVILPDENGTTGRATVSNPLGAADLVAERQATSVIAGAAPSQPRMLDDRDVRQMFGTALSTLPLPPLRVVLRFQFDSDDLTNESRAALPSLVRQARERPAPDVVVVGHTDTVGSNEVNRQLGLRRAEAVRRVLVEAGLDPSYIVTTSHGEADPAVSTRDNTSEPANRRVEITLR
jgi:outer membrane protein OmpA-like peptidoglycan-associated protein